MLINTDYTYKAIHAEKYVCQWAFQNVMLDEAKHVLLSLPEWKY